MDPVDDEGAAAGRGITLKKWALPLSVWALSTLASCVYLRFYLARSFGEPSAWTLDGDLLRYIDAAKSLNQAQGLLHLYAFNKPNTPFVTPPGFLGAMAAIVRLLGVMGQRLDDYYGGGAGTIPSHLVLNGGGWSYLLPIVMAGGLCGVLCIDALLRRVGTTGWRRATVLLVCTAGLWWTAVIYEHPDDALAIGLVAAAASAFLSGRQNRAAWIFATGCAVQPLVLLALVPFIGTLALRRWPGFLARVVGPSVVLLIIPFIGDFTDTFDQVVTQPVDPRALISHPTPVLSLAPHIAYGEPSGSPLRLVAFALAIGATWWALRRPTLVADGPTLIWLAALALDLRVVGESVVYPYDLAPGLVVGLVAASRLSVPRLGATAALSVAVARFSEWKGLGEWPYWLCLLVGFATVLLLSCPIRSKKASDAAPTPVERGSLWSASAGPVIA